MVRISFFFIASNLNNAFKVYDFFFTSSFVLNFVSIFFYFLFIFTECWGKRKYILSVSLGVNSNIETLCWENRSFIRLFQLADGHVYTAKIQSKKELWFFNIIFFSYHFILFYRLGFVCRIFVYVIMQINQVNAWGIKSIKCVNWMIKIVFYIKTSIKILPYKQKYEIHKKRHSSLFF